MARCPPHNCASGRVCKHFERRYQQLTSQQLDLADSGGLERRVKQHQGQVHCGGSAWRVEARERRSAQVEVRVHRTRNCLPALDLQRLGVDVTSRRPVSRSRSVDRPIWSEDGRYGQVRFLTVHCLVASFRATGVCGDKAVDFSHGLCREDARTSTDWCGVVAFTPTVKSGLFPRALQNPGLASSNSCTCVCAVQRIWLACSELALSEIRKLALAHACSIAISTHPFGGCNRAVHAEAWETTRKLLNEQELVQLVLHSE